MKKKRLTLVRNKPQSDIPDCPDFLSVAAKKIWRDRAPRLAELGLLTHLDRAAFAMLCDACAEYRKLCKGERKVSDSREAAIFRRMKRDAAKQIRKLAAEFYQAEEFEEWLKQQ